MTLRLASALVVLSLSATAIRAQSPAPYQPITAKGRLKWTVRGTIGPKSLIGGVISAGWDTGIDRPWEYGPHWEGFGKRFGIHLTSQATSHLMEAGLGAAWGEDPRYFRAAEGQPFKNRAGRVIKMTFVALDSEGHGRPAYARYAAFTGSAFLTNTWRADSVSTPARATRRIGSDFLGRMVSNALSEFWPDIRRTVFRRNPKPTP